MKRIPKITYLFDIMTKQQLLLQPICPPAIRTMLPLLGTRLFGQRLLPRPYVADIKELGDGNPMFLETEGTALQASLTASFSYTLLKFADERFEGATLDGKIADHYGKYFFSASKEEGYESFYAGQWQDAKPCGSGVRQYANGSVFLGEFCSTSSGDMAPNGIGICTVANGDIMAGRWKDGIIHGEGMQQTSEGGISAYVGNYVYGLRSGLGVYNFTDASEYAGHIWFQDDAPHGYGSYRAGKTFYMGCWSRGKRSGWSIFSTDGGSKTWAGRWDAGALVWSTRVVAPRSRQGHPPLDEADATGMQNSWRMARIARTESDRALQLADAHCNPNGPLQTQLEQVQKEAKAAGEKAEAAARKARSLRPLKWQPTADDGSKQNSSKSTGGHLLLSAFPVSHESVQSIPAAG